MDIENNPLYLAVYNNALWCDSICRSHNVPGEFLEMAWMNRYQPPLYYPDLITLTPTTIMDFQQGPIAELLAVRRNQTISVKDSFALLDLTPIGFHRLFEAQWIFREASTVLPFDGTADLQWQRITSERELIRWEAAWSDTPLSANRIFLPSLLEDGDTCIMAANKDNQIVAGAIANKAANVVGLSNVFTPTDNAELYWRGFLSIIAAHYPSLPVVGYEQDDSLPLALQAGFTTSGPLTVWIKDA